MPGYVPCLQEHHQAPPRDSQCHLTVYRLAGHLPPHAGLLLVQLLEISLAENGNDPGSKQTHWGHTGGGGMRYPKAPSCFGSITCLIKAEKGPWALSPFLQQERRWVKKWGGKPKGRQKRITMMIPKPAPLPSK